MDIAQPRQTAPPPLGDHPLGGRPPVELVQQPLQEMTQTDLTASAEAGSVRRTVRIALP